MGDEQGNIEGGRRGLGIERRTRRKVKDENVSSRIRSCDCDLFSLILHLCPPPPTLFHSPILPHPCSFPLSHLYLFPTISHSFSLSYPTVSHQREGDCTEREKKTSHAQFWCTACQACFECAHTAAYTRITPAYSQGKNRIKEYRDKAEKGGE